MDGLAQKAWATAQRQKPSRILEPAMSRTVCRIALAIAFALLVFSSVLAWFLAPYHFGL